MDDIRPHLEAFWHEYGGRIVGFFLVLVIGWSVLRRLVGSMKEGLARTKVDATVASFLTNTVQAALVIVIVFILLQLAGVQAGSLLTLVGAIGVAVALALQGSLANFASGLLLLSFRLVRVGDLIEIGDVRGRVTDLLPFHTVLVTADNQRVTLPNSMLTGSAVRNHSTLATRRAQWTLSLTPRDNLSIVKDALRARLLDDPRIIRETPPLFFVQDWTDDKRTLLLQAWTKTSDYQAVQQELLEELGAALEATRR